MLITGEGVGVAMQVSGSGVKSGKIGCCEPSKTCLGVSDSEIRGIVKEIQHVENRLPAV